MGSFNKVTHVKENNLLCIRESGYCRRVFHYDLIYLAVKFNVTKNSNLAF